MTAQAARYRLAWLSARRSLKSARTLVVELQRQSGTWRVRAQAAEERLAAVEYLFAGRPDTPCRTVWRDGGEYVEVPIDDLRAALDRAEGAT